MSGVRFKAVAPAVATGTALKTLLQLVAAANHGVLVKEWGISFNGISNTAEPIVVKIVRQTTAGTMTPLTCVKDPDDSDETLQTTAQHTATLEPTTTDILWQGRVHPQNGMVWQAPYGEAIKIGGGDRLAIQTVAPASVSADSYFSAEE